MDEQRGVPLEFATVSLQDAVQTTNQVGYFEFESMKRENALLQVEKIGYKAQITPVHLLKR